MKTYSAVKTDPARWFSPDEVAKAKRYQKPLKVVRLASGAVSLGVFLWLVFGKVAPRALDALGPRGWALQLLLVVAGLVLVFELVGMPFEIWREFSHERRWGFSTQTAKTYVADQVKSVLVSVILLGAMSVAVWAIIRSTDAWWLLAWAAFFLIQVLIIFLGPVIIMPLFNKFTPTQDEELRSSVRELGRKASVSISDVLVMDASKRTRKDNAFFTGLGRTKRVVVFDNMLEQPRNELEVVVAHEIGHWRNRHIVRLLVVVGALTFVLFLVLRLLSSWETMLRWAGVEGVGDPGALPLVGGLFFLGFILTMPAQMWLSRAFERQADLDALVLTTDVPGFMSAMRGLATKNLGDLAPSWWQRVKASHPPVAQRLAFGELWERERAGTA